MSYRTDLAKRLFGLKSGDGDTAVGMARAIGNALLDDVCSEAVKARRKHGPGFWVFTTHNDGAIWETAEGLKSQIDTADANNDHDLEETFRRLLTTFEGLADNQVLVAIADERGLRACVLDADNPGMQLDAVLRDATRA